MRPCLCVPPRPLANKQDYAALAPTTADRILDWERRLELGRPAFEARYAKAAASDPAAADKVMATWTQGVAASAGALLDDLAEWAAEALGMPSLPSQERWLALLDEAAEAYAFEPTSDDPAPALARPGQPRSGGGATAMQ